MITSSSCTMNNNPNPIAAPAGVSPTGNNNSTSTSTNTNEEALRQEVAVLKSQLRKVSTEKYRYEQTFRSIQDRMRSDVESSLYLQSQSYEARLTELHSVIGVLKQRVEEAEGRRIQEVDERSVSASEAATGTEADEHEDDPDPEPEANDDDHDNDNEQSCTENKAVPTAAADPQKSQTRGVGTGTGTGGRVLIDSSSTSTPTPVVKVNKNPAPVVRAGSPRPPGAPDLALFHAEIQKIRTEHLRIKHCLRDKEKELVASRWTIQNLNQEKNYMQDKVRELEQNLNRMAKLSKSSSNGGSNSKDSGVSSKDEPTDLEPGRQPDKCKTASKVQLQRNSNRRHNPAGTILTGPQVTSIANTLNNNPSSTAARVLTDQVNLDAQIAELLGRESEKGLEIERLHYALQNALAENEVLQLNLQDGKDVAESLTLLVGKYESRFVTMELLNEYSSQLIESYGVLVALLESELGQLLANCRAVGIGGSESCCSSGIGSSASPIESDELLEVATLLQRANENRAVAESAAGSLLGRIIGGEAVLAPWAGLERHGSVELFENPLSSPESTPDDAGWGDTMSSTQSQSTSSPTAPGAGTGFAHCKLPTNTNATTKDNVNTPATATTALQQIQLQHRFTKSELDKQTESRVRSLIIQLKTRQESLRSTLQDTAVAAPLPWNLEEQLHGPQAAAKTKPAAVDSCIESRRNDLEIAILMQELMALKEERAELRGQIVYMEKDRKRVQVVVERLNLKEIGYQAQIQLLTSQVASGTGSGADDNANNNSGTATGATSAQINQLISTINKLNESQYNAEQEYKAQIAELSTSNRTLLQTLQTSKSRYEKRVRKMEEQIVAIMERHVEQIRDYKDKIRRFEATKR